MIKRTVEISNPSRLRIETSQLVIEQNDQEAGRIPIEDLGVLILDHPAVSLTHGVLEACAGSNAVVVLCDKRHMPVSVLQPMEAHTLHARILAEQIRAREPTKKRLWQQIVQAKIAAQARNLDAIGADGKVLFEMARRVKSGDPVNLEAQAARVYWVRLFGLDFRRDTDGDGLNALLNYGYAILRATVARAISAAGLHPALGLHHSNQYNSFALADDLMEPLRPLVDMRVCELRTEMGAEIKVEKQTKQRLLGVLTWPVRCGSDASMPLMVATHSYAASVRRVLIGEARGPEIPHA